MPKELTRAQKLHKYGAPKEVFLAKDTIMGAGDIYECGELIERIESFYARYPECPRKIVELKEDYYDGYYSLVGFATRPLTIEEEDVIIAKGDKKAEGKEKSFAKAKADYEKALAKKYPNYKLPDPE